MATTIKVPNLGQDGAVEIIEVIVSVGDVISKDDSLIVLESDKASMEVPAEQSGTVTQVLVSVGDKVNEGSPIIEIEAAEAESSTEAEPVAESAKPAPVEPAEAAAQSAAAAPAMSQTTGVSSYQGKVDQETDMLVLGAGPGGYSAAFRAADLGMKTLMVDRYARLGGVCLNVGCIPSKALLHTAAVMEEVKTLDKHGIRYPAPTVDLDQLRGYKDSVISTMTTGLAGMAKARQVELVQGIGTFLDANHLEVTLTQGDDYDGALEETAEKQVIKFNQAIIAAGSQPVKLPFIPDSDRVIDSTGALELADIPERMLVIGGGIIGLEMATVYASLGSQIDIVEMMDDVMQGADKDLVKVWHKMNDHRFTSILAKTKTTAVEEKEDGLYVTFEAAAEGVDVPAEPVRYDRILVAVGRSPNGGKVGAENAGVAVSERGFIDVDSQMRTNVSNIFAIGDLVGQPMLAHKAVHEGHVAAEAAHGEKAHFDVRQIPSVAYTDPEVAWAGVTELECKAQGIAYEKAVFPWAASGRAVANGRSEGFTKLLFDPETHRVIGGAIVGVSAGDMIGEICLAIEMGADATDIGKTIHPHPTLGESIGMAAEVFEGVCTDLPPKRKRK